MVGLTCSPLSCGPWRRCCLRKMAVAYEGEVKTHFFTKEGEYRLIPEAGLIRPSKLPYNPIVTQPVRLSLVTLGRGDVPDDRVVFNVDREIYFSTFCGATEVSCLIYLSEIGWFRLC